LPQIPTGVASWSDPSCKSGTVNAGTVCNIVAAKEYSCVSPGLCDAGQFQKAGTCTKKEIVVPKEDVPKCEPWCAGKIGTQACDSDTTVCTWSKICGWKGGKGSCSKCSECKCTLPQIPTGVASWSDPSCKSGTVNAGTVCNIVAAKEYSCVSPGLCDAGQFQKAGTCTKKEIVVPKEDVPKCEPWCAGKIGTQACDSDTTVCTWSKICGWKGGRGSCSKCSECTSIFPTERVEMPSTTQSAGVRKQMSILSLMGATSTMLLF